MDSFEFVMFVSVQVHVHSCGAGGSEPRALGLLDKRFTTKLYLGVQRKW